MKPSVLFVDDDKNILDSIKRVLSKEDYKILTANSAKEALRIIDKTEVRVIITDECMPCISGSSLLSMIRQKYPNIVRIMLTGNANVEIAIRAINEGEIYRFFTKPCNHAELAIAIRDAINQQELILQSQRLVAITREQSYYIKDLEGETPGLGRVDRTETGAIILHETPNLEDVLTEICEELTKAEKRLGTKK